VARLSADSHPRGLRIVFLCQAVDLEDPVLPTTVRWIEALARKPAVDHVTVLALRVGRYDLPPNVHVAAIRRSNRLTTSMAFYRGVFAALRPRPDCFFVYQGGPYPMMLLPFKWLARIPIVQWKAHPVISRKMKFYARWCDDLILTSARAAFPMDLAKVRVVGQGVDTEVFRIEKRPPLGDLIAIGRIAPIKGVEELVKSVAHANRAFGTAHRLNVYGPTLPEQEAYAEQVAQLIDELGADEWVKLNGPVHQERLPQLLNAHRASINLTTGALDKTAVEAMACGLPLISSNDAVAEIMPADLHPLLIVDKRDTERQAEAIHELLRKPQPELEEIGTRLRALAVSDHSTERLFDRILEEIDALLEVRR
jgi:glycosyltransferase involved in cell wall biosynthesis